ncbi:MAG: CBS domain-containing protein [Anaerolineales bacterium]|jgi:signal-transduction protein with cAMP-binding, CBS, and nucleotidyltransferase domain
MANENPKSSTPRLVRDLMTVGVVTCSPKTPIKTIVKAILEKDLEAVVVLDPEGHALGIVGQDELVHAYAMGNYENLTAQDVMTDGIPQVPPDIPLAVAAQLLQDQGLRVFYLTHHAAGIEYPAALITYKHFLRLLEMREIEEIEDLGIKAKRQAPLDAFIERRDALKAQNKNIHLD